PYVLSIGLGDAVTGLSAFYNQALSLTLDQLAAQGLPTIRVDAFSTIQGMAFHPAQFGFTNVTQPFLSIGGDPAEFLFWDPVHPTMRGHAVLADALVGSMIQFYPPGNEKGQPPARINALNGLVGAPGKH